MWLEGIYLASSTTGRPIRVHIIWGKGTPITLHSIITLVPSMIVAFCSFSINLGGWLTGVAGFATGGFWAGIIGGSGGGTGGAAGCCPGGGTLNGTFLKPRIGAGATGAMATGSGAATAGEITLADDLADEIGDTPPDEDSAAENLKYLVNT